MRQHSTNKSPRPFQNIDLVTVIIYLVMVVAGWFTIYAAGYDPESTSRVLEVTGRVQSQLIWMGISFTMALIALLIEPKFIKDSSPVFYSLMILLLIATIFLAPDIKGSRSWLVITETVRIQPAEFAKVTTAMMLAWWGSRYEYDIKKPKDLVVSLLIFLLPLSIIVLQSETGSALVFLSFLIVLYREGLTSAVPLFGILLAILFVVTLRFDSILWGATDAGHFLLYSIVYISTGIAISLYSKSRRKLWLPALMILPIAMIVCVIIDQFADVDYSIGALIALLVLLIITLTQGFLKRGKNLFAIVVSSILAIALSTGIEYFFDEVLQPHQQTRILVSLGMKDDPAGAGYNVRQSLIAIGSGEVTGKGFLNGTQTKLAYVPEQDTDFIFCTIGEEHGFIGSVALLSLFAILLLRLIQIAERQNNAYARMYGYSVASIIFFHVLINIGMVIGLIPVIGIPLPFFSYGGSSLLSFTILLFILLRFDSVNSGD